MDTARSDTAPYTARYTGSDEDPIRVRVRVRVIRGLPTCLDWGRHRTRKRTTDRHYLWLQLGLRSQKPSENSRSALLLIIGIGAMQGYFLRRNYYRAHPLFSSLSRV